MTRTVVGIVGGIASGKSTVAAELAAACGAGLLDADAVARRVLMRPRVRDEVGRALPRAVGRDGKVDRARLAELVFRDGKALARLESILHPPIRRALQRRLERAEKRVVLIDAPLLQETGLDAMCDLVAYVTCPARLRRTRSRHARGWTRKEHDAREARQWSCRKKRARADFVVRNGSDPRAFRSDLRRLSKRIEALRKR